MDFERWFQERTSRFERILLTSTAILLVLLFVSQALLTQPGIRRILSLVDRLEGVPVEQAEPNRPALSHPVDDGRERFLELSIVNRANGRGIEVRVNGQAVAAFGNSKTVRIPVRDGDEVEVDGALPESDVVIAVTAVSEDIAEPIQGKEVTFFGRPETVSYVTVERN